MLSEDLIAAIYAVATDQDAFEPLGGILAEEFGYRYGLLSVRRERVPLRVSLNQPVAVTSAYQAYYFKLDPWTEAAWHTPYGQLIQCSEDDAYYDTEFYRDFARPMGVVDPVGLKLQLGRGAEMLVGLNQKMASNGPTPEDGQRLLQAGGHLQRALQLQGQFEGLLAENMTLTSTLDRVTFGLLIVAADGRIEAVNKAGEDAVAQGCGLSLRGGMLTANGDMAGVLAMLIRDAITGGAGGALRLPSATVVATTVLVSPLPPQTQWPQVGSRALVTFKPPMLRVPLDGPMLASAFGLSRVEAQVAIALMEGRSLDEVAAMRGVKLSTVKSQLNALFEKTGTRSQRELVRLLATLPPVRTR